MVAVSANPGDLRFQRSQSMQALFDTVFGKLESLMRFLYLLLRPPLQVLPIYRQSPQNLSWIDSYILGYASYAEAIEGIFDVSVIYSGVPQELGLLEDFQRSGEDKLRFDVSRCWHCEV